MPLILLLIVHVHVHSIYGKYPDAFESFKNVGNIYIKRYKVCVYLCVTCIAELHFLTINVNNVQELTHFGGNSDMGALPSSYWRKNILINSAPCIEQTTCDIEIADLD